MSYTAASAQIDNTSDSADEDDLPYYLAGPCPPWCDRAHEDTVDDAERLHMSTGLMWEVMLVTEDPVKSDSEPHTLSDYFPPELAVYMDQHVREVSPRIAIDGLPAGRTQLHLLPAEARTVGEALIHLAEVAEGRRTFVDSRGGQKTSDNCVKG
ncbi:DUF6907 domain-containing protein [Actinocrispum wychmicini]|uniref:Uncharacterized protein n=1 Tax=Actinocrispum wychmicini TaxID=1213861 RepID=A0A4R2JT21_9PSEU|nr:hypothetical protein [Actinocrispum wychmicini]TCO62774.1 hypothetical protein EV192_102913 [Actinocrispum wychmicini]